MSNTDDGTNSLSQATPKAHIENEELVETMISQLIGWHIIVPVTARDSLVADIMKHVRSYGKKEVNDFASQLEGKAVDVVYVASEKDRKLYSEKPSKATPLEEISELKGRYEK